MKAMNRLWKRGRAECSRPPPPPRPPPRPRVTLPDRHPGGFPYESGGDDRRLA